MAAAVGSLMIRFTDIPEIVPASCGQHAVNKDTERPPIVSIFRMGLYRLAMNEEPPTHHAYQHFPGRSTAMKHEKGGIYSTRVSTVVLPVVRQELGLVKNLLPPL